MSPSLSSFFFKRSVYTSPLTGREEMVRDQPDSAKSGIYGNILSLITESVITFNLNGHITGWNKAAENVYHFSADEVLGKKIQEVIPDFFGEGKITSPEIHQLASQQQAWCKEAVQTLKHGRKTTVRVNYTSFIDPVNQTGEVVAVVRDLGNQIERDRQRNYQHKIIQELSYIGVISTDYKGKVLQANPTALKLLGYSESEIKSQRLQNVFKTSHSLDFNTILNQVLRGEHFQTEIEFHRQAGPVWLSLKIKRSPQLDGDFDGFDCLLEDITSRRAALNRLEAIQNRLQLIISATNEVLWDQDLIHNQMWWSEGLTQRFGYNRETAGSSAQWWEAQIHPDDRERVLTTFKLALKEGRESLSQEYRFKKANGAYATVQDRASIVYAKRKPVRAVGAMMDVTVQQVAEKALHLSLSRFKTLFEQSPMSSQVFDIEGKTLMVNPAWQKLWGLDPQEVLNYNVRKDPQLEKSGLAPLIEKAFQGEAQFLPEIHYQPKNTLKTEHGRDRWVKAYIYPVIDEAKKVKEVVIVHQDVTEAKRAQEELKKAQLRYESLFNSNVTGVMVVDKNGTIYEANDKLLKLLGYSRSELEAGILNWMMITPSKWRDKDLMVLKKLLQKGQIAPFEKEYLSKEGTPISVMVSIASLAGSDGKYIALVVDNRKRKRAEAGLVETKNQLSIILQNIADGITVQNKYGEVIFANNKAAMLSGFSGKEIMSAASPKDFKKQMSQFTLFKENGEPYPINELPGRLALKQKQHAEAIIHYINKNTHESRWSQIKAQPVVNEAGEVEQAVNIITDVTPRKQLEEVLHFKAEASRILASSFDYHHNIQKIAELAVNQVADWCVVDLRDKEDLRTVAIVHKKKSKTSWAKGFIKSDPELVHRYFRVSEILSKGKSKLLPNAAGKFDLQVAQDSSLEYIHKKIAVNSLIQVPIMTKDKVIGSITLASSESHRIYTDSEKELAEQLAGRIALAVENAHLYYNIRSQQERLEKLVANVPGVVWEAWGNPSERKQRVNFVSRYVKKMIGYSPKEWLNTPNFWLQIVHPEDRERAAKELSNFYLTGKGGVSRFRWIAKNGSCLWVESHSDVIKDKNGQPVGMRGVIMDVTQRMEIEQRKDDFISMASHELKTPVTSIKVFTQILTRMFDAQHQEKPVEYLNKMDIQVNRLTTLVSELLNVSKIQAGRLELAPESFDLAQLISDIVETMQHNHPANAIVFKSPGTLKVKADRERVSQVLINLMSNAIKYSPKNNQVKVFTKISNNQIIVSVADKGMGISKKHQDKIFDRFYRVYDDKDKTFPGLGMGLYISNEIIKRHGGKMWLQSSLGKGSTFSFSLPL